uniref:hypothetical protein n=1 Tax=Candidatus Ichthyocystis sparus TaxID=1561004 RepID=UPI000AFF06D0
ARSTYSSVVAVPVSSNMRGLSSSEQCACLITNMMLYKTSFMHKFFLDYCGGLCSEFICSLFSVIPGDASGRRLLSLTGNRLRGFWVSLSGTIMRVLQDIFAAEWSLLTNRFSVLSCPEESSSTVLCVGDFISAHGKVGVPNVSASGSGLLIRVRGAAARGRALSHVTEVASGSSTSTSSTSSTSTSISSSSSSPASSPASASSTSSSSPASAPPELPPLFIMGDEIGLSMVGAVDSEILVTTEGSGDGVVLIDDHSSQSEEEALVVDVSAPSTSEMLVLAEEEGVEVSEVGLSMVGVAVSHLGVLGVESSEVRVMPTTSASSVTSSSVVEVEGSSTIPRIGSSAGPVAPKKLFMKMYSAGMSSSSTSSGSIISSGSLSSVPVATTGSVSPLATTTGIAPGGSDIGERLAALMNRGLPPSPPPASESVPTGGVASSSTRGSGRGRRKRKRRN